MRRQTLFLFAISAVLLPLMLGIYNSCFLHCLPWSFARRSIIWHDSREYSLDLPPGPLAFSRPHDLIFHLAARVLRVHMFMPYSDESSFSVLSPRALFFLVLAHGSPRTISHALGEYALARKCPPLPTSTFLVPHGDNPAMEIFQEAVRHHN